MLQRDAGQKSLVELLGAIAGDPEYDEVKRIRFGGLNLKQKFFCCRYLRKPAFVGGKGKLPAQISDFVNSELRHANHYPSPADIGQDESYTTADSHPDAKMARKSTFLIVVVFLGFLSRHDPIGLFLWDKSLGDLCYGAGAFLTLSMLFPRQRPEKIALTALVLCLAVECFKLTGLPRQWQSNPILRVIFGSTFSFQNVVCYVIAIALMCGIERVSRNSPEIDR
jgi:hypothetical protein